MTPPERPSKAPAPTPGAARRGGKPTLKTIAALSGLAVPTVSRALSDAPDIGAATKARVRQIARDVGYEPNRAGLGLRTGRTNVVSLVLAARFDMMNHTALLITTLAAELRRAGYNLIVTPYTPEQDPMDPVRQVVRTGMADALILNQMLPDDPRVRFLAERGFPFATHGRTDCGIAHPWYDYDNEAFGRIAIRELAARGCRSVAMIAPPRGQTYAEHMIAAAAAEAGAIGIAFEVAPDIDIASPREAIEESVARRLAGHAPVDGFVCASNTATMAAVASAEAAGRKVGADIQFFAKETASILKLFRREIVVVSEDLVRTGEFLSRAVLRAIRDPEAPPMQGLEAPGLDTL